MNKIFILVRRGIRLFPEYSLLCLFLWFAAFGAAASEAPAELERKSMEEIALDCGSGVTLTLAKIPAGTFMMGSPKTEAKRDAAEVQHQVTISKAFYMGIFEVTQAQYRAVMGTNPSEFEGDDLPVETVSWNDATDFCRKLSEKSGQKVRLPTEAEWEYACRAGTTTPFNTGETISTDLANYDGNSVYGDGRKGKNRDRTTPVGSFLPNAWGIFDMHGNVWEWCSDWYNDYDVKNTADPQGVLSGEYRAVRGDSLNTPPEDRRSARRKNTADPQEEPSGTHRVVRGGSWNTLPRDCRSARRFWVEPHISYYNRGFRVSLDL